MDTQNYLGKFKIIECIKKDKYFGVYLANHIFLGKNILLKTLDSSLLEDRTILDRFNREAKILAKLEHPNIIRVMDFGIHENTFYISFEFFKSQTLRELIQSNSLTNQEKRNIVTQLFQALDYAHKNGIIHRDIKPENILVDEKLKLKIADFGLALGISDSNVTNQYSVVGTPAYMSPEQIRGEKLNEQSDLFSAGITIFELFTSTNPCLGSDVGQTINNILSAEEINIADNFYALEDKIQSALRLLLHKQKAQRAKSAEAILALLDVNLQPLIVSDDKNLRTRSKLIYYILAGSIILIVLGVFVIKNFSDKSKNPITIPTEQPNKEDTTISLSTNNQQFAQKVIQPDKVKKDESLEDAIIESKNLKEPILINSNMINGLGKIMIECSPWAEIFIDDKKIDTTPLKDPIWVQSGQHRVSLKHPDYPTYKFDVELKNSESIFYKFSLASLFGFIELDIFPWGEVYLNGDFIGVTPLKNSIIVTPGEYRIELKNPNYLTYTGNISLSKGERIELKYNFENQIWKVN